MPTTTWRSSTKAKRWRCITPNASPHQPSELCCTPRIVAAPSPAAPCPAISAKSTTRPLRHQPRHRHQRPHLGLRPQPQTRRTRLDHPQKRARRHRMDPTTAPRPRPTPHQHVPSPREAPTRQMTTTRRPKAQRSEYRTGRCLSPPTNVVATDSGSPVSSIDFSLGISSEKKLLTSMRASAAPRQKCTP